MNWSFSREKIVAFKLVTLIFHYLKIKQFFTNSKKLKRLPRRQPTVASRPKIYPFPNPDLLRE